MANASNNGLLPLNNGQQANGQGGYSQVSPMMGMYYNAAQAPQGNAVLGYNYGAGGMMPGGVSNGTSATPTPPTGGSLTLGTGNTGSSSGTPSATPKSAGPYSASNTGNGNATYGGYNANAQYQHQQPAPVAAQSAPAAPHYNPNGPLGSPNAHMIAPQVMPNSSGQMQGSSQPLNSPDMFAQLQAYHQAYSQPNLTAPPGHPGQPGVPITTGQGGNPHGVSPGPPAPPSNPVTQPAPAPTPDPVKGSFPGPNPPGGIKKPTPPPPKPKPGSPPSAIDKWLAGDVTYQQQLAEYNQEQQAYNQNYTNSKDQIDQNFNATQRSMNNQAALDRMNQQYDFAGRGVLASGAYAQALDQYNTQFQNNIGNLVTGENQQLTANQTNLNNFLRQVTLQRNAAKQDAIARRAAQLGITA